jgi:hypothetical protein
MQTKSGRSLRQRSRKQRTSAETSRRSPLEAEAGRRRGDGAKTKRSAIHMPRLGNRITKDNPVGVVDVFVNRLDLAGLGFESVSSAWLRGILASCGIPGWQANPPEP